jgi:hypothetical protein
MRLLDMRYGCDTVLVIAHGRARRAVDWRSGGASNPELRVGMSPCDLASLITPEVIRAWYTPPGLREEWLYRTARSKGQLSTVFLEGPSQRELLVKTMAR